MVDAVIFIPGAGGSTLVLPNGDDVWPPTFFEFIFTGYKRIQQLKDDTAQPQEIVDTIPLHNLLSKVVYAPILGELDQINAKFPQISIDRFPYDFRKSALDAAKQLKIRIEYLHSLGKQSIALVCHSAGNLVARALLEDKTYQPLPWFQSIEFYLGICGPHLGVPEVQEYALGKDSWLSVSAGDMQSLTKDSRYPGAYELLPFKPQNVLYDTLHDVNCGVRDYYIASVAAYYGFDWNNLCQALDLQQALNFANKPAGVRYRLVAAQGQSTHEHVNYDGTAYLPPSEDNAGDGTNPLWTSSPNTTTTATAMVGDHFGVMSTGEFRELLWQELTNGPSPFLAEQDTRIVISLNKPIYRPGEEISALLIPDVPTSAISADLEFSWLADEKSQLVVQNTTPFVYSGPTVKYITARITAPKQPGVYRLTFKGKTHATDAKFPSNFAVSLNLDSDHGR